MRYIFALILLTISPPSLAANGHLNDAPLRAKLPCSFSAVTEPYKREDGQMALPRRELSKVEASEFRYFVELVQKEDGYLLKISGRGKRRALGDFLGEFAAEYEDKSGEIHARTGSGGIFLGTRLKGHSLDFAAVPFSFVYERTGRFVAYLSGMCKAPRI